jgi:hypothetical protein
MLFNTMLDDTKLKSEIWINNAKLDEMDEKFRDAVDRLKSGDEVVEVSTGLFSLLEDAKGIYDGETYDRIWRDVVPDHLAVLPDGIIGACSVEDGCGAPRLNAEYQNPDSGFLVNSIHLKDNAACDCEDPNDCQCMKVSKRSLFKALKERLKDTLTFMFRDNELSQSDRDIRDALGQALSTRTNYFWIVGVFQETRNNGSFVYEDFMDYKTYALDYNIEDDGTIILSGDPIHVRPVTNFVPVKVGETNATPTANSNPVPTVQEEITVDKEALVQALIDNAATKFTADDQEWLMTLEEEQLTKLEPEEEETPPEPTAVTPSEETPPAEGEPTEVEPIAAAAPTVEDYVKNAPSEIQEVLNTGLRMQRARRNDLVKALLENARNKFTKEQLQAKPLDELENLASLADVPDYSAAGAILQNASSVDDDAPPEPKLVFNLGKQVNE